PISRVPPCPSHTRLVPGGSLVTRRGPDVQKVVVLRPRECSRRPSASVITNHVGPFAGWSVRTAPSLTAARVPQPQLPLLMSLGDTGRYGRAGRSEERRVGREGRA